MNVCYMCGKLGHHIKDCKVKDVRPQGQFAQGGQVAQGSQAQPKGGQGQHNNRLYALHTRQEVEETLNVVTSML